MSNRVEFDRKTHTHVCGESRELAALAQSYVTGTSPLAPRSAAAEEVLSRRKLFNKTAKATLVARLKGQASNFKKRMQDQANQCVNAAIDEMVRSSWHKC